RLVDQVEHERPVRRQQLHGPGPLEVHDHVLPVTHLRARQQNHLGMTDTERPRPEVPLEHNRKHPTIVTGRRTNGQPAPPQAPAPPDVTRSHRGRLKLARHAPNEGPPQGRSSPRMAHGAGRPYPWVCWHYGRIRRKGRLARPVPQEYSMT